MFYRFRFESSIYPGLSRIPLHVRMKLDLTGTRISLKTWLAFSPQERTVLCHLPTDTQEEKDAFSGYLDFLSQKYLGKAADRVQPLAAPPWEDSERVPIPVQNKSHESGQAVTLAEWSRWNASQRYALYKLAVSKYEPDQFHEALKDFRAGVSRAL